YVWWALGITFAVTLGAFLFAPRWPRLRQLLGIISPLEYLKIRYNLPTQQLLAWSGTALKVFDVGAKWTAMGILLNVFAGVPLVCRIILTGGVKLVCSTVCGTFEVNLNDFGQFVIQLVAGVVMFFVALSTLGGVSSIWTMWDDVPERNASLF